MSKNIAISLIIIGATMTVACGYLAYENLVLALVFSISNPSYALIYTYTALAFAGMVLVVIGAVRLRNIRSSA